MFDGIHSMHLPWKVYLLVYIYNTSYISVLSLLVLVNYSLVVVVSVGICVSEA